MVPICDTEMSEGKADDVENEMEEIIDREGAHQKMEIPQNLKAINCYCNGLVFFFLRNVMLSLGFHLQWKRQKE